MLVLRTKLNNRIAKYLDAPLPRVTPDYVIVPERREPRRHVKVEMSPLCDEEMKPQPLKCGLCPLAGTCKSSLAVD